MFTQTIKKHNAAADQLKKFGRDVRRFLKTQTVDDKIRDLWEQDFPHSKAPIGYLSFLMGKEVNPVIKGERRVTIRYVQRGFGKTCEQDALELQSKIDLEKYKSYFEKCN